MKKLGFIDKIIFAINSLVAFLLLLSYLLPYVPPKSFATLSVLSLGVPLLIILNVIFFVFWLARLKKQFVLSMVVLMLGYNYVNALYKFSSSDNQELKDEGVSIMSFNVRLFNKYEWLPSKTVKADIIDLIKTENPDILALQEYPKSSPIQLEGYYSIEEGIVKHIKNRPTIFSKYPIINSGSLDFKKTTNNAIYSDVLIKKDTIRVYNIHLQSSGINTDVEALKNETSENLFKRIGGTFKQQQEQAELILEHQKNCPYKMIVAGDFNNTAYSYVYNKIKGNLIDAFDEAGSGFSKTFHFKFFPIRIDFVLVDPSFQVLAYKRYGVELSDHYPIKTLLKLD